MILVKLVVMINNAGARESTVIRRTIWTVAETSDGLLDFSMPIDTFGSGNPFPSCADTLVQQRQSRKMNTNICFIRSICVENFLKDLGKPLVRTADFGERSFELFESLGIGNLA